MYPGLSKELHQRAGIDNGYRVSGGLEMIDADTDVTAEEWRGDGSVCREVDGAEMRRLEPDLAARLARAF